MTVQPMGPGQTQAYNSLEAQLLAQQMGLTGAFGAASASDTLIFLGEDYVTPGRRQPKRGYVGGTTGMVTVDQANAEWVRLDAQQAKRFDDAIEKYTGKRQEGSSGLYWWEQMVKQSGALSSALGRPVSVFETAEMLAERSPAQPSGDGGPTTTFSRTEQVNLTNPMTARGLLDNALGSYLGRMPTRQEYKSFLRALNMGEEAAPTINETTTRSSGGGSVQRVTSKGRTEGGFDQRQFATEYAKGQEEYAETQVSTTGLQAFLELLK